MKIKQIAFVAVLCAVCAIPIALVGRQARTSIANGTSLPTTCAVGDLFYLSTSNGTGALNVCFTPSTWAPANTLGTTTFYVCAKAASGTCVYNGDGGTVATPSDAGACVTKAAPCATLAGVRALMANARLTGIVTIQLADTAGTGTDCYQPNGVIFDMPTVGGGYPIFSVAVPALAGTDVYPSTYVYVQGNTTTPTNVVITGAGSCAGTTPTNITGLFFKHNMGRVNGVTLNYFKAGAVSVVDQGTVFMDNISATGGGLQNGTEAAVEAFYSSSIAIGGTWSINGTGVAFVHGASTLRTHTATGYPTLTYTASTGEQAFLINEFSHMFFEGGTYTFNGSGAYFIFFAQGGGSTVSFNSDATTTLTFNASNATELWAAERGFIYETCGSTSVSCTFTSLGKRAVTQSLGAISYGPTLTLGGSANTSTGNGCIFTQASFPTLVPQTCAMSAVSYTGTLFNSSGGGMTVANVGANSCGTTAATITGNNNAGFVTVGATSGTQCRIRFNTPAATAYDCTANEQTQTIAVRVTPVDTQHVDLIGSFGAADKIGYTCFAR